MWCPKSHQAQPNLTVAAAHAPVRKSGHDEVVEGVVLMLRDGCGCSFEDVVVVLWYVGGGSW